MISFKDKWKRVAALEEINFARGEAFPSFA
jgi:hypothetical protein